MLLDQNPQSPQTLKMGHSMSPEQTEVEMNELVLPSHTNSLGTIFGGQVMAWIDIAAAMAAMKHARTTVVTASIDALTFWRLFDWEVLCEFEHA